MVIRIVYIVSHMCIYSTLFIDIYIYITYLYIYINTLCVYIYIILQARLIEFDDAMNVYKGRP